MPISRRSRRLSLWLILLLMLLSACDTTPADPDHPTVNYATPTPAPTWTPITPVLSQTIDGITVGIQPLHADAHRITIALRIEGPAKPHAYGGAIYSWGVDDGIPSLSLGADSSLTWSESTSAGLAAFASQGEPLQGQTVLEFYAGEKQITAPTSQALLNIPIMIDNDPYQPPEFLPTSAVPVTNTPTPVPMPTEPPALLRFTFSPTIPFDSQQDIIQINQTVENNGVAVTLEQADITFSEARLKLRFAATKPDTFLKLDDWYASGPLLISVANGGSPITVHESTEDEEYPTDHGCYASSPNTPCTLNYLATLTSTSYPTEVVLTLTAGSTTFLSALSAVPPPYGTWTFHFTIPASTK